MFKLNEVVIHKSAGACVVCDIVTKNFGTGDTMYYLLKPKFPNLVNKALEIFLPVEKEKDFIRKPLTKTAVLYFGKTMSGLPGSFDTFFLYRIP